MILPYSRGRHRKFALTVTALSHVPYLDTSLEVFFITCFFSKVHLLSNVCFASFLSDLLVSCRAVLATRIQPRVSLDVFELIVAVLRAGAMVWQWVENLPKTFPGTCMLGEWATALVPVWQVLGAVWGCVCGRGVKRVGTVKGDSICRLSEGDVVVVGCLGEAGVKYIFKIRSRIFFCGNRGLFFGGDAGLFCGIMGEVPAAR